MTGISTPQLRVLRIVRTANDEGRGVTPPSGPSGTTFMRLEKAGLIEDFGTSLVPRFWLTLAGRADLDRVEGVVPGKKAAE